MRTRIVPLIAIDLHADKSFYVNKILCMKINDLGDRTAEAAYGKAVQQNGFAIAALALRIGASR
jgi:hypothetical protein